MKQYLIICRGKSQEKLTLQCFASQGETPQEAASKVVKDWVVGFEHPLMVDMVVEIGEDFTCTQCLFTFFESSHALYALFGHSYGEDIRINVTKEPLIPEEVDDRWVLENSDTMQ